MEDKKSFNNLLNKLSLSFNDKVIETDFLHYHRLNIVQHVRIAMLISLGIYAVFAVLDSFLFPEFDAVFHKIRFYLVFPFVVLVLVYTLRSSSLKYLQLVTAISVLVAGYGIIFMLYIGGHEVSMIYYVGLTLVLIFNYDFLKLRFLFASLVGGLILLGYIFVAVKIHSSPEVMAASLFFLFAANIMGMVSAYFYEFINRKYFYSNLLLEKEKIKTADINTNLEGQVRERTSNLEKVNKDLFEAKIIAEESERLKSVFLATMSHELRTPLNAIIGFSDIISLGSHEKDEILGFSQIINNSGQHLLSLVESLFDITLIDSGQEKLNMGENRLFELLANVNSIMLQEREKIGKNNIHLELKSGNIKNDFKLFTDGNKIKQGLINLLKNALKFTESGEVSFWCDEIIEGDKSYLKFYVQDTGIGIPPEKKEFIFDVFRQVDDTHSRKYGGVGIGLTVVRKLVSMLGGDIGVDSVEGIGSTFYFTIGNYIKEELLTSLSDSHESVVDAGTIDAKILVVEDDEASYLLLQLLLEKNGAEVVWAENGENALRLLDQGEMYDLILMDLNMPVLNGYETSSRIKELYPEQIIIAQTAYAVVGDREKALAAGCNAYITKPISATKLNVLIADYL